VAQAHLLNFLGLLRSHTKGGLRMESKPSYLSKTLWINVIMAGTAFIPGVHEWLSHNPEAIGLFFAGVNFVLRFISKDKITLV